MIFTPTPTHAPLQTLRGIPASPSCMHPCVSTHVGCFQARRYSWKTSALTTWPTWSEGTFELSLLFQESRGPKGNLLGLQSPGTCYLGQQAKGNHVLSADKATMRPACCSKEMTCSQIIAGLAAYPPKAPKPKSPMPLALTPTHS